MAYPNAVCCSFCQREHDHLEWNDHRKDAEVVDDPREDAVDAGDIPGSHRGANEDQCGGGNGDEQTVARGFQEGVFADVDAVDVVIGADKRLRIRKREGIRIDRRVGLKGVHQYRKDRHQIDHTDDDEDACQPFSSCILLLHYCCTSLLRVAEN